MATIRPFAAWRPKPELAGQICELPYDVMSTEEARALAAGNPLSFLHISKPEIDLANDISHYDSIVYKTGLDNFTRLIRQGTLMRDPAPCFYLYRQIMGPHSQVGLVAGASCNDYQTGIIKRHELTRPDKEEDRLRHIDTLNAQTGPAFLVYRARASLDTLLAGILTAPPEIDFVAKDGIRHSGWVMREATLLERIMAEFARLPCLYIADGHHRSAAACRIAQARQSKGDSGLFLSVIFPDNQVQILPYNRVLRDLNGRTPAEFMRGLSSQFSLATPGRASPSGKNQFGLYMEGKWFTLRLPPLTDPSKDPAQALDVSRLQSLVLAPMLGITDLRTSKRIDFVGGIRGTSELERLVDSGQYACAFSLYPTGIGELMAIADAGGIMPPKSTWFEPKLRDGMFCYPLGEP